MSQKIRVRGFLCLLVVSFLAIGWISFHIFIWPSIFEGLVWQELHGIELTIMRLVHFLIITALIYSFILTLYRNTIGPIVGVIAIILFFVLWVSILIVSGDMSGIAYFMLLILAPSFLAIVFGLQTYRVFRQ